MTSKNGYSKQKIGTFFARLNAHLLGKSVKSRTGVIGYNRNEKEAYIFRFYIHKL